MLHATGRLALSPLLLIAASTGGAVLFGALHLWTQYLARQAPSEVRARYGPRQAATFAVLLLPLLGAWGMRWPAGVLPWLMVALFAVANAFAWARSGTPTRPNTSSIGWLAFLFGVSGVAALIYQVTWQRSLFAAFGVNIESTTLVVTVFMAGLGLGALAGGVLSERYPRARIKLFVVSELFIGLFGVMALPLIHVVGDLVVQASLFGAGLAMFGLLLVPTLLMGATLPLLVAYVTDKLKHVGRSMGLLYFVNTLGSALACFWTADILFTLWGQQGASWFAAACNWVVSFLVWRFSRHVEAGTAAGATP